MNIKKIFFLIIGMPLLVTACSSFPTVHPTGRIVSGIYAVLNTRPMFVNFYIFPAGDKFIAIDAGANSDQTLRALKRLGISPTDVIAVFITHSHHDHIGSLDLFVNAVVYTGDSMSDGEVIEIKGVSIKCIYTPGHTLDSVCFLINGKYLFVGDTLINHRNNVDNELRRQSVESLANIGGVQFVFTAHQGFTDNVRRMLAQ
jgi:glyoxylase-like metal-dependent hydrolase (beta-lactamase superfamily II)